ncbi:MAG: hypothetical protein HGB20_09445 [Chlorobiaceae bacterium]|nr:hypothetical protein [Chlorobiaceae bacterium]
MTGKNYIYTLFSSLLFLFLTACGGNQTEPMTDRDGNSYPSIKIGNQLWTAKNLEVAHYRNGDPIPEVRDSVAWSQLKTGAWCWYENSTEKGKIYGRLYNWYAVNDPRGLAPQGWHVAKDADWDSLSEVLGGDDVSGGRMKSGRLWKEKESGGADNGFELLPGGARRDADGAFVLQGEYSRLWSSTESNEMKAWGRAVGYFDQAFRRGEAGKRLGFAVRCVRD